MHTLSLMPQACPIVTYPNLGIMEILAAWPASAITCRNEMALEHDGDVVGSGLRIGVCALHSDFAGMSAVSVRSGRRTRKVTRGLPGSANPCSEATHDTSDNP